MRRSIILFLSVLTCLPAWAVWEESVAIEGAKPDVGTRVSWQLPNGDTVTGEVRAGEGEDEDRRFFFFVLPGDGPSAGSIVFQGQTLVAPLRPRGESLVADLSSGVVRVASSGPVADTRTDTDSRFEFSVEVSRGNFRADELADNLDNAAADVQTEVFDPIGASVNNIFADGDDDDNGMIYALAMQINTGGLWQPFVRLAYSEFDGFRGIAGGEADFMGAGLRAQTEAQAEYTIWDLKVGVAYQVTRILSMGVGLGAAEVERKDAFVTTNLVNGMVVGSFAGGTTTKEFGTSAEVFVDARISRHLSAGIRANTIVDATPDDSLNSVALYVRLIFPVR